MKEIYFDNNATTKVDEAVFEEMRPYFCELYGNPSSMHFFGGQVQKKVDEARNRVAALLGADPAEIVFTACGTESDNAAIRSALEVFPEKRHIITTRVEHPAVLTLCRNLSKRGYRVTELNVDGAGRLDLTELKNAIDSDTAIVSIMYANNETGVVFPIEEVGAIVKEKGALFHTDAVQAVGKISINMAASTVDMLSLSGHKLHAPRGSALSICARECRSGHSWWGDTRSETVVPAPRQPPPSSRLARRASWRPGTSETRTPG